MNVRWTEPAASNWEQAFEYIAQDNLTAALAIAEKIIEMTELLEIHPFAGRPGRISGTREMVIPDSPFVLAYSVDSGADVIWIYAVYPGRRRWSDSFSKK